MKALGITHKGAEDIACLEIKELIGTKATVKPSVVVFTAKKVEDLCKLCYKGQSFRRVMLLLKEFKVTKELLNMKKELNAIDFSKHVKKNQTFRVECVRIGEHSFQSSDIAEEAGAVIDGKVDLENPDIRFLIYIHDRDAYLGIDFSGFDMSKRDYKIFAPAFTIKGTIAYTLVRLSGYKKGKVFVDPFCGSATIPIEAAFFASCFPVNFYRKEKFAFLKFIDYKFRDIKPKKQKISGYDTQLRMVRQAQKNAQIAGVKKIIELSKIEVSWMDTKFKEATVDCIASNMPVYSERVDKKAVEKSYHELFYQAKYVLKKTGKIALACNKPEIIKAAAEKHSFKLEEERIIMQGKMELAILVFKKS